MVVFRDGLLPFANWRIVIPVTRDFGDQGQNMASRAPFFFSKPGSKRFLRISERKEDLNRTDINPGFGCHFPFHFVLFGFDGKKGTRV